MHQPVFHRGRLGAPAPAAALLLALCLLAVGAQAVNETANTSVPVAGDGQNIDRLEFIPTPVITAQPTPTLCGYADAYPMPNFTADRTNGTAPLTVRFTDTSSEWAYNWHWDFGDDSHSTEENPVHTFCNPGVYPVTLSINEHDHFVDGCMWVHYWSDPRYGKKTVQVTVEGTDPTPYKPLAIPGRIEAEDYNTGGEGVAYHDTTPANRAAPTATTRRHRDPGRRHERRLDPRRRVPDLHRERHEGRILPDDRPGGQPEQRPEHRASRRRHRRRR